MSILMLNRYRYDNKNKDVLKSRYCLIPDRKHACKFVPNLRGHPYNSEGILNQKNTSYYVLRFQTGTDYKFMHVP